MRIRLVIHQHDADLTLNIKKRDGFEGKEYHCNVLYISQMIDPTEKELSMVSSKIRVSTPVKDLKP